jgi:molybdopterin molybdotransferase
MHDMAPDLATRPAPADPRPKSLLTVAEALEQLLAGIVPLAETECVETAAARGRVLAAPLQSRLDVPAADNAQMDGYAVCRADIAAASAATPITLPVSQRIPAGHEARHGSLPAR